MSLAAGLKLPVPAGEALRPPGLEGELRTIYAEHFTRVWRSLRRLGVADAELEDAAQDVFVVVYRRWAEFEHRSSLKTWIYGIVLRVAKDYRRSEERHNRRVQGLAEEATAGPCHEPEDEAERREARRLIHRVLGTLADEQREVLVLVELEQLPVREAASALGLHVRACQRRLRAAHHALEAGLLAHLSLPGKET